MTKQSLRALYLTSFLTSLLIVDPVMAQNRIGPSFECDAANVAKQPVAQIICYSDELARLDLSYVIAYQALRHTLNDQGRRELTAEANALILSVTEQCNIPKFGALGRTPTSQEIACIKGRYELKQRTFLGRLSGDALEEAKLQPEEILTIQRTLQTKGFLPATATIDGVFGPMTRTAISTWQQSAGLPDTGFGSRSALTQLSGALRQLQPQAPVRQEQVQTPPPPPKPAAPIISPSRRVALIIANSKYQSQPPLRNPANDAILLASALTTSGFQSVTVKTDLTREQMLSVIRDFAARADTADWAAVYYSGHGVEYNGINYMVPVDARLEVDRDIDLESVDVGKITGAIEGAKKLRLLILDSCRNNPFVNQMRRTSASRSIGRGLAQMEPEAGMLVVYAAKHGQHALDGEGTNSPFAEALAKRIKTPNIDVRRVFDLVRDDVMAATNRKQQPFSYGSLSGNEDFYFVRR